MARPQLGSAASRQTDLVRVADLGLLASPTPGFVAEGFATSGTNFTNTLTDLPGMTVTFTAIPGRTYRISAEVFLYSSVNSDNALISVTDASNNQIMAGEETLPSTSGNVQKFWCSRTLTGLSGSVTYKVRGQRILGTGIITVFTSSSFPGSLFVVDITPSTIVAAPTMDPAGVIKAYAGTVAPAGSLMLDGSTITSGQTLYPNLWAVIPASWKSGANIVLPDARGRTIVGAGTGSGLSNWPLSSIAGEETHLLTYQESGLPGHVHAMLYVNSAGANPYGGNVTSVVNGGATFGGANYSTAAAGNSNAASAHNNIQPSIAFNWIISTGMVTIGLQRISGLEAALPPSGSYVGQEYCSTDAGGRIREWDGGGWVIMSEPTQTAFNPAWVQGVTISKNIDASRYVRSNGWCSGHYRLTASSAGTAANMITGTLPISSRGDQGIFGSYQFYNSSIGFKSGPMYVQGANIFSLEQDGFAGAGITTPTIASGDILWVHFDYEMATRYS